MDFVCGLFVVWALLPISNFWTSSNQAVTMRRFSSSALEEDPVEQFSSTQSGSSFWLEVAEQAARRGNFQLSHTKPLSCVVGQCREWRMSWVQYAVNVESSHFHFTCSVQILGECRERRMPWVKYAVSGECHFPTSPFLEMQFSWYLWGCCNQGSVFLSLARLNLLIFASWKHVSHCLRWQEGQILNNMVTKTSPWLS